MTPAQATGHPNFVTDWPVQGPTDEGVREADCRFAKERLPVRPACADCSGPVPPWARTTGLAGEQTMETIAYGGVGVVGFALSGPGDPEIWGKLTTAQQLWIQDALSKLNDLIVKSTGSSCPTWAPPSTNLGAAIGCFQTWYNANYAAPKGPGKPLRTDSTFDEDTLCMLQMIVGLHGADFHTPIPGPAQFCLPPCPAGQARDAKTGQCAVEEKKGLSTGAMVAVGAAAAAVLGGIVYAATR